MMIRICPYCDQEMTKKHHCDNCNSFVWKAKKIEVRRNAHDTRQEQTSYDAFPEQTAYDAFPKQTAYDASQEQTVYNAFPKQTAYDASQEQAPYDISAKTEPYDVRQKTAAFGNDGNVEVSAARAAVKRRKLTVSIVCMVIIIAVVGCIGAIIKSVRRDNGSAGYGNAAEDDVYLEGEPEDIYLEPEDVAEYTGHCNTHIHLDVDGEMVMNLTEEFLGNEGVRFDESEPYFWGYERVGADGEKTGEVVYEWEVDFSFDDNYDEWITICYDAVTHELHSLTMVLKSKDMAVDYLEQFFSRLMGVDTISQEELLALFDEGSDGYDFCKHAEVSVYSGSGDTWHITVDGSDMPFKYDEDESPVQKELTDDEVMALGQECNYCTHMDVQASEKLDTVNNWLSSLEAQDFTHVQQSQNVTDTYRQMGGQTFDLNQFCMMDAWRNADGSRTVVMESDTFSGRLHSVAVDGMTLDELENVLTLMTQIAETGDAAALAQQCRDEFEADGYAFAEFDGFEIYVSTSYFNEDDQALYVELTALW